MNQSLRDIISILVMLLALSAVTAVHAAAEDEWDGSERPFGASLTVNQLIAFTIGDESGGGLQFGSIVPGSVNNPDEGQAENGAIILSIGVESNTVCEILSRADDYISGENVIPISNATWNTIGDSDSAGTMSEDATVIIAEVSWIS